MTEIFILAGEASGDLIGASLMRQLAVSADTSFIGVGGERMEAEGLKSIYPIEDLSVMGFVDVVRSLPKVLRRLGQTVRHIIENQPDIVVLIDSQVFASMLARRLRKKGYRRPIVLYVAPSVWAYAPERARKIEPLFDEVLAILPFEPSVMRQLGGPPTVFVGHPAMNDAVLRQQATGTGLIALMPGSRRGELRRHMPMYGEVVGELVAARPELEFHMPMLPHNVPQAREMMADWPVDVKIVTDISERRRLASQTELGLIASGTATLEAAFSGMPMVVTYVMDAGQRRAYRHLTVEHISLPNIILNRDVVPELLFERPDSRRLSAVMRDLLADRGSREDQLRGFAAVVERMRSGLREHPRQDPAERILAQVEKSRRERV